MKTYIPLDRLKRSRDSGSALYNMHPTDVLGRAGGGVGWRFFLWCVTMLYIFLYLYADK